MSSQRLMAIDPGGTTGLATHTEAGYNSFAVENNNWQAVLDFIHDIKPDVISIERFATSGRISVHGLRTVELVGMVTAYAYLFECELIRHQPQARYAFMKEAKLLTAGRVIHETDAMAHLLAYEWKHKDD